MPIFVEDIDAALAEARAARDGGADLVEYRVDTFFTGGGMERAGGEGEEIGEGERQIRDVERLVAESPVSCVLTCRPVLEGGHFGGSDAARVALLERVGAGARPARYVDVELATYTRSANLKQKVNLAIDHPEQIRDLSTSLILSSHDFHSRPPDLIRRLERMYSEPACRVVKVAYFARSLRDNLELLDIVSAGRAGESGGKPIIALGMGPFGLMSRVLAPKFGGFLTFASLRRDAATAPGQPVLSELLDRYRFRSIGSATRVYGVVGWPVEHSLSPVMHNAGFEAVGHDGVYLPMPVPAEYEHFKATVLSLVDHEHLDLSGLSVTMPHKEHLVRLAREEWEGGDGRWEIGVLAERCGAGNTLVIERDGRGAATRLKVVNTDGPAIAEAVGAARRVLVLGAGGTARAAATELLHRGKTVMLWARSAERARGLAEELGAATKLEAPAVVTLEEAAELSVEGRGPEALVNATPAGMAGGSGEGAMAITGESLRNLSGLGVVVECVYNPVETPLVAMARAAGVERVVDGLTTLVGQAAEQFRMWTGVEAPRQLFDRMAREEQAARGRG